jgi:thymidylate synthase ThyX
MEYKLQKDNERIISQLEKLIMTVKLIAIMPNAEVVIEKAGKTCYCSTLKAQPASEKNLIYRIIKNRHHSVLEHASVLFLSDLRDM